jgi:hypothetical protein
MPEEPDINTFVSQLKVGKDKIIEILCSIIKQQMLYGGTLADKINYWWDLSKKDKIKD